MPKPKRRRACCRSRRSGRWRPRRSGATATASPGSLNAHSGSRARRDGKKSAYDVIEEVPPGAILDFDDPEVRIVAHLPRQIGLDVRLRLGGEREVEEPLARARLVERRLRRRTVEIRVAVERAHLDEDRPRLL